MPICLFFDPSKTHASAAGRRYAKTPQFWKLSRNCTGYLSPAKDVSAIGTHFTLVRKCSSAPVSAHTATSLPVHRAPEASDVWFSFSVFLWHTTLTTGLEREEALRSRRPLYRFHACSTSWMHLIALFTSRDAGFGMKDWRQSTRFANSLSTLMKKRECSCFRDTKQESLNGFLF